MRAKGSTISSRFRVRFTLASRPRANVGGDENACHCPGGTVSREVEKTLVAGGDGESAAVGSGCAARPDRAPVCAAPESVLSERPACELRQACAHAHARTHEPRGCDAAGMAVAV